MKHAVLREQPAIPRSILVGSDLSEASDQVVREAARLANAGAASLHVVAAYEVPETALKDETAADLPEAVVREVRDALPAQLRRVLAPNEQPETQEVRFGGCAAVILDRAAEIHADVIVLGPHRGRDVHAAFLGTTADEVLRRAHVPCLVTRGSLALPPRRVGVATDLSPEAHHVLAYAVQWATWLGEGDGPDEGKQTRLDAVHVASPREGISPEDAAPQLERTLAAAIQHHGAEGLLQAGYEVLPEADPADALVRYAEREGLDLMVVGTRGRSAPDRQLPDSVSATLARRSPCPLLVVPSSQSASRSDGP